jgi:hypothetical protein
MVAWPVGPTVAGNLAVLCRRHHRLKHSAGWPVALNPDATMTWTTPSGRKYTSEPWNHPKPPDSTALPPPESELTPGVGPTSDEVIEVPEPPPQQ